MPSGPTSCVAESAHSIAESPCLCARRDADLASSHLLAPEAPLRPSSSRSWPARMRPWSRRSRALRCLARALCNESASESSSIRLTTHRDVQCLDRDIAHGHDGGLDLIGPLRGVRPASWPKVRWSQTRPVGARIGRSAFRMRRSVFSVDSCPRGALKWVRVNGPNPRPHAPCRLRSHDIHLFPSFPCLTFPPVISRVFFRGFLFLATPSRTETATTGRDRASLIPPCPSPAHHKQRGRGAPGCKQSYHCHGNLD